jgi:histidine triad (HIT) family protein
MDQCIFCRIARGEVPATVVYEDEQCVGFRDLQPRARVHVLLIPRAHIPSVNEVDGANEAAIGHLVAAARSVAAAEGVAESGYRLVINTGPDAGQSVAHLHLHVLGGRELAWPPG